MAKGVLMYVMYHLKRFAITVIIIIVAWNVARWTFGFGMDNTDASSWSRSGLVVHVDALTGVQYLSDGKGGLIKREGVEQK